MVIFKAGKQDPKFDLAQCMRIDVKSMSAALKLKINLKRNIRCKVTYKEQFPYI
jgi:hypothetical protein